MTLSMSLAPLRSTQLLAVPALLIVLLAGWAAQAQQPAPTVAPRVTALRVEKAPRIDGKLDDEAWQRATFLGDFLQKEPEHGKPASLRTEVAFLYDTDALYVGARMFSGKPEDIETALTRRDESGSAERFIVSLDTYRDRRTAYSFAVTAAGVRVDWFHPDDNESVRDLSFNPVWEARTTLGSDGWQAELRIPFSQLRFNAADEQVWGININRYIPRRNEDDFWVVVPRENTGWSSYFGELTGIRSVAPSHRVEFVPYVAADLRADSGAHPRAGTPFEGRRPYTGRVGLDAKVGLGPNLTLDATVNPDFGQIDADPAQVNLTAFETAFEERRPFFTEGGQLLNSGNGPVYFYSRRIGGAPRFTASADFVEAPLASTIWGAAKLTGRLSSGLSLATLGAFTGDAFADTYDFEADQVDRVKLDTRTGYGVLRAQQELGTDGSVVGATFTTTYRDIGEAEGRTGALARAAYTGGADFKLRLRGGEYVVSGYAGGSSVHGLPDAITRLQRSSARYFQRPDQSYVQLDPEATSLPGYTVGGKVARQSGTHWLWNAALTVESPGFDVNDVGRITSADDIDLTLGLTYRETQPGEWLRAYDVGVKAFSNWNYGGVRTLNQATLTGNGTFPNFWSGTVAVTYVPKALSDQLTRGGPLMQTPQGVETRLALRNNISNTRQWSADTTLWRYEDGSRGVSLISAITFQPISNMRLSLEPTGTVYTEAHQYVTRVEGGGLETYGQRYIFAAVQRRELSLRLRANLFLTPDLSLEAYAEPFSSSGVYSDFGELARARSQQLRRYGQDGTSIERLEDGSLEVTSEGGSFTLDNPDFNLRSFRSNVVLRWEFRPGSTLFVVWQQDRSKDSAQGNALAPRFIGDALLSPGGHTFAVKLAWWFPTG